MLERNRRRILLAFVAVVLLARSAVLADLPGGPLTMDLVVDEAIPRGDKTTYFLRATASGGAPPYYFQWTNATPTVGQTVNPNRAVRTCLNSQTVTVKVCFANAPTICDSVTLGRFEP